MSSVSLNNIQRTINAHSPMSGMVSEVFINKGQYISLTDVMLEIINPSSSLLNVKCMSSVKSGYIKSKIVFSN